MTTSGLDSTKGNTLDSVTLRKGLLWQQWDKLFSRWKERYFILTRDYLACFKKGSKIGTSEMGSFLFKLNLVDVEGLQWLDKKRDGVIALRVGQDAQLLLWSHSGLEDWMLSLREAISCSKGRREALRKSQTLIPQMSDGGMWIRCGRNLQHTLSDSQVALSAIHRANSADLHGSSLDSKDSNERQPTPHLVRRLQCLSVLTDIDIGAVTEKQTPLDCQMVSPQRPLFGPRLAPQCSGGSHSSLVSLGRLGTIGSHLQSKPSPRSLQVSPALTQRSLYAQHILSSPEITTYPHARHSKSASTSVASEFAYIHPDSPLSVSAEREVKSHLSLTRHEYQRSHSCLSPLAAESKTSPNEGNGNNARPSSLYDEPASISGDTLTSNKPPDVIPQVAPSSHPQSRSHDKRTVRPYNHSKSDTSFVSNRLSAAASGDSTSPSEVLVLR